MVSAQQETERQAWQAVSPACSGQTGGGEEGIPPIPPEEELPMGMDPPIPPEEEEEEEDEELAPPSPPEDEETDDGLPTIPEEELTVPWGMLPPVPSWGKPELDEEEETEWCSSGSFP